MCHRSVLLFSVHKNITILAFLTHVSTAAAHMQAFYARKALRATVLAAVAESAETPLYDIDEENVLSWSTSGVEVTIAKTCFGKDSWKVRMSDILSLSASHMPIICTLFGKAIDAGDGGERFVFLLLTHLDDNDLLLLLRGVLKRDKNMATANADRCSMVAFFQRMTDGQAALLVVVFDRLIETDSGAFGEFLEDLFQFVAKHSTHDDVDRTRADLLARADRAKRATTARVLTRLFGGANVQFVP
jgi:hypothetical protein